jgi:tetratricopeptide (TPR) repeat protein
MLRLVSGTKLYGELTRRWRWQWVEIAQRSDFFCEYYQFHEPRREYTPELIANKRPSTAGEATMFAWVRYRSGDRLGAIADARKAIELNPRLSCGHSLLGVFFMTENPSEAINHFTQALEANPKSVESIAWRGTAYLYLGSYREALKDSEAALVLDAKLHLARWLNLYALASCGEVDRAIAELNKWSQESSSELILNALRGHCYLIQGRFNDAVTELTEALRRDPSDMWAYSDRAVALSSLGKEMEATQDLEQCSRLAPALRAPTEARMKAALNARRFIGSIP